MMKKAGATSFNGNLYFSHRKTNLCGVAIGYVGSKLFVLADQTTDKIVVFYLLQPLLMMLNLS